MLLQGQPFSSLLTEVMFLTLQISLLSLILTIVILIIVMVRTVTFSPQVWVFLHLPQSEFLIIYNLLLHYFIYLHSCGTCLLWDRQIIEKSLSTVIQNEQLNILHPVLFFLLLSISKFRKSLKAPRDKREIMGDMTNSRWVLNWHVRLSVIWNFFFLFCPLLSDGLYLQSSNG